jgi:hypothetical protein
MVLGSEPVARINASVNIRVHVNVQICEYVQVGMVLGSEPVARLNASVKLCACVCANVCRKAWCLGVSLWQGLTQA